MAGNEESTNGVPRIPNSTGDSWSHAALIAANLLPLVGAVFLGWDLLSILLLYWLETLLIGGLAVLRALWLSGGRALGAALMFLLVFIALNAAHMAALVMLAGALDPTDASVPDLSQAAAAPLFSALRTIYVGGLEWIAVARPAVLVYGLPALVLIRLVEVWQGPALVADRQMDSTQAVLRQALGRVIVLHLTLLLGSAVIAALHADDFLPMLALLILFKLLFELRAHQRTGQWARSPESV